MNEDKINEKEEVKKENLQNKEFESKNQEPQQNARKEGFFKKVYDSITKIEKYPEMAAQGLPKAMTYLAKLVVLIAIVLCIGMVYQTYEMVQDGISYLQNDFPEFSYKDGILTVNSEKPIVIENSPIIGKVIVDTNVEDTNKINEYITSIEQSGDGIIVLKDKVILKNISVAGTINYNYKDILGQMQINEFNKQSVIDYAKSSQIINLYISVFLTLFVYTFSMYFLTTLSNALILSIFGYFTTWIAKIRMRYVAIFNMTVYSLTLSIILNILYIAINIFIDFNIEYFQVMYVAVAAIYLVAAIFILKSEFIKKQQELIKLAQVESIVKEELEKEKQEQKDEKEKKEREKKDREDEKKDKDDKNKEEPEGSKA